MSFLDDYEPVETRLRQFWEKYPDGRVETQVSLDHQAGWVVTRAEVYTNRSESFPFATGYARSPITGGAQAEGTHPLETCETSAIGRALANGNFASKGAPRPSREEMASTKQPATVNLLALVEQMGADEKAAFAEALTSRWKGIGLAQVPSFLTAEVTAMALEIVSGRYAQPPENTPDLSEFSEEPF